MIEKFNIEMLDNITGCEDGFTDKLYKKGEKYTIGSSLFNSFKNMGVCKLVENKKETKKVNPVVENKKVKS